MTTCAPVRCLRVPLGRSVIVTHKQLQALYPGQPVIAVELTASTTATVWRSGRSWPQVTTAKAHKPVPLYLREGDYLTLQAYKAGAAFLAPLVDHPTPAPGGFPPASHP